MQLEELLEKGRFTILLGKNGCGKSSQLRRLDSMGALKTTYLTPERGGVLKYDPNLDHNMENNPAILVGGRRRNRVDNFRAASMVQWRLLETDILRKIETDPALRADVGYSFTAIINRINALLPNVEMRRARRGFEMYSRQGHLVPEDGLSSGESELITLAIEVLVFSRDANEKSVLLMDEPDVHLHPDLQQRFMAFVEQVATDGGFRVVVATHSTAIVAGFANTSEVQIVPVTSAEQRDFKSFKVDAMARTLLPIFGAHPLSSLFNNSPPLLVEGEDDRRVIDQLVRSSNGKYNYSPAVVGTVNQMHAWEGWLETYLPVVYDRPVAYSLRDLDSSPVSDIDDLKYVRRARLNCYSMENLLLCNESLRACNTTAERLHEEVAAWIGERPTHQASKSLTMLAASFDQRRIIKIKDCRNVLVALMGIEGPWESFVGRLLSTHFPKDPDPNSLATYLGQSVLSKILAPS